MNDFLPQDDGHNDKLSTVPPEEGSEGEPTVGRGVTTAFTYPPASYFSQASEFSAPGLPETPQIPVSTPLIPHLLHTILFFGMAVLTLIVGQMAAAVVYQLVTQGTHPHRSLSSAFAMSAADPRISIPVQALIYGVLVLLAIPVFSGLWMQPFWETLQWNRLRARRYFFALVGVGLLTGIGIGAIGNLLPMPPSPPILNEMSTSTLGAWFMLIFGITAAPMTEELAFRGFLLPSLLNLFRLMERRGISNAAVTRWVGIPVSILLTSLPFALLHAQQVSDSWGPLVLIGLVSVVLCVVRLTMKSVACSAVVHAAYNFTLFAGVVYQTSGFQHLNKLVGS